MTTGPHRHRPGQKLRRAGLLSAASGRPTGERTSSPLSAVALTVLEAHSDNAGERVAGCGARPCDGTTHAAMGG